MSNLNNQIEYINDMAEKNPSEFVNQCENRYKNIIRDIANKVCDDTGREIIMVAGPSSSGKTTTANKIAKEIVSRGVTTYVLSLDDFYKDRKDIPFLPDGTQDFETVYALDLECFEKTVNALLKGEKVKIPKFDFTTGTRTDKDSSEIILGETDAVIIEGLHALNPVITDKINGKLLKIYISVSSRIYDEKGKIILNKRNLRFIRRMIRDYNFRGSSVDYTYRLWKNVMAGEDKYLFPYRSNADIRINTIHLYEPCVMKEKVLELLENGNIPDEFKEDANKLKNSVSLFKSIDKNNVPNDSLLKEFLG